MLKDERTNSLEAREPPHTGRDLATGAGVPAASELATGRTTSVPWEASLLEILDDRAAMQPDRQVFCFLEDGEFETESLTYRQLQRRSRALADQLQQHADPGDRIVLVYPPGLEFITALFGCFSAGLLAVPVQPPRWDRPDLGLQRLDGILRDSQPAAMLTCSKLAGLLPNDRDQRPGRGSCRTILTDIIEDSGAESFAHSPVGRDTVALLQYTSGSTGEPRGVLITHGNLLANQHVLQLAFEHRTAQRMGSGVCWLPFYHDMGLVGNVLQAVYVDATCYLMSPLVLLQRPVRWLEAISRYRAHSSGGPNFAFDLCVQRITAAEKARLDLSCWHVAAIGAEPVSHRTIEQFAESFAPCGFRREAFYPCYGLAEATLFVSGGEKESSPVVRSFAARDIEYRSRSSDARCGTHLSSCDHAPSRSGLASTDDATAESDHDGCRTLVGCGHAWTEHEIVIADPATLSPCPPGTVGEIWFRGPSVAAGYWSRPEETQRNFHAHLKDSGHGPFLRTGDLGFFVQGELFVTGRIKDVIVIRGQNHYPQDIEESVRSVHDAFRPNSSAACGCPTDGEDRLVILQEIDRQARQLDTAALARIIRQTVAKRHQLQVHEIVFLHGGSLPKTTSGKLRRHECVRQYLRGELVQWTRTSKSP